MRFTADMKWQRLTQFFNRDNVEVRDRIRKAVEELKTGYEL